jgi:methyl-accepting chemotaxis protein
VAIEEVKMEPSMAQGLREILTLGLTILAIVVVVNGIVFLRLGWSLATRLYFLVLPAFGLTGLIGFTHGTLGDSPLARSVASAVGATVSITVVLLLYKMVVRDLRSQIEELVGSLAQLSAASQQAAATAAQQAATVTEVTATVEELMRISASTAETAQGVLTIGTQAVDRGQRGIEATKEARRVIETVGQVEHVVDTVADLAAQSNLLAINASIEAAKAGEYGRGFSVVASEVRSLAEQSRQATGQIRDAVSRSQEGQHVIEAVNVAIEELAMVLQDASQRARQIYDAADQQASGIRQITEAMRNVSEGGASAAATARQLDQAVAQLRRVADRLRAVVVARGRATQVSAA